MPWHLPWVTVRMSRSTAIERSTGDRMHPCLTPVSTLRGSVTWLLCMTRHSKFSYKMFTNFCWIPFAVESSKSMVGLRCQGPSQSPREPRTRSCSIHVTVQGSGGGQRCVRCMVFPFLKPACSRRSSLSTAVLMRWRIMRQKTLLLMGSSVMPLLLLHSDRFHFFGSLIIVPLFKTLGIISLSQTSCWMR